MLSKVHLKLFFKLNECETFVNNFVKDNRVARKEIIPVVINNAGDIRYFVYLEYEEM